MRNTFKTLWVVPTDADRDVLAGYFHILHRADEDLDRDPASCLPLWRNSIPAEFQDRRWDFARFNVGERFHYLPVAQAEFGELLSAAERWGWTTTCSPRFSRSWRCPFYAKQLDSPRISFMPRRAG